MVYNSILIADDHEVVRSGLAILVNRMLPQADILQADSLDGAIKHLKKQRVELMLCDINMPGGNTFQMLHRLRGVQPDLKILVLTAYQMNSYEKKFLQEGANGYLSKTTANEEIQRAITAILRDGRYDNNEATVSGKPQVGITELLSYREMEVARLLTKGLGILEISNTLDLQSNTVSTYKKRIFVKLNTSSVPELISVLGTYPDWQVD